METGTVSGGSDPRGSRSREDSRNDAEGPRTFSVVKPEESRPRGSAGARAEWIGWQVVVPARMSVEPQNNCRGAQRLTYVKPTNKKRSSSL